VRDAYDDARIGLSERGLVINAIIYHADGALLRQRGLGCGSAEVLLYGLAPSVATGSVLPGMVTGNPVEQVLGVVIVVASKAPSDMVWPTMNEILQ
jgi:hypothetical protein